jgi:hypothetical protein
MTDVSKLKIGAIDDDKPVTITIKLPAAVHRDLIAYAEILSRQIGQPVGDPTKVIVPMIARFMATDRAFAKARKLRQEGNR